jgi:hypothetical protein
MNISININRSTVLSAVGFASQFVLGMLVVAVLCAFMPTSEERSFALMAGAAVVFTGHLFVRLLLAIGIGCLCNKVCAKSSKAYSLALGLNLVAVALSCLFGLALGA